MQNLQIKLLALKEQRKKGALQGLPTAEELRASLLAEGNTPARNALNLLFDEDTFVETGAFVKRGYHEYVSQGQDAEFEGVITGYGSINGELVFAFAQDETRMMGAIDEKHVKKILDLYNLALKKEAPVVGIFASSGAFVDEGVTALAAYSKLLMTVTEASNSITQIAYILGNCVGTAAAVAASFDFVVQCEGTNFYLTSKELGGSSVGADILSFKGSSDACANYIRNLLAFLPIEPLECLDSEDDINRRLDSLEGASAYNVLASVADLGNHLLLGEEYGKSVLTALTTIAGVKCGVVVGNFQENEGRIDTDAANKLVSFLNLCDAYAIPVVNLVDSYGLAKDTSVTAIRDLAYAYASLEVPSVTVILKHAVGAAFALLGSKSMGADLVYTLEGAEIGVLPASASVAFAWNDQVTTDVTREELESRWLNSLSSPVAAVSTGEIDDMISDSELRARIASALLMLTC